MESTPYVPVCRGSIYVLIARGEPVFIGPPRGCSAHNFLQAMEELHQCRLLSPGLSRSRAAIDGTGIQRAGLGLQIDLGVDVSGVERNMSEPSSDRVDVDARSEQM